MEFTIKTKDGWTFSTDKLKLVEIYAVLEMHYLSRDEKIFLCGIVSSAVDYLDVPPISADLMDMVEHCIDDYVDLKDGSEMTPEDVIWLYQRLVTYSKGMGYDTNN